MRGKYERSPVYRFLHTDAFGIMFFGYYQGLIKYDDRVTVYKAACMFCELHEKSEIEPQQMISAYSRLTHIIRDMNKK